MTGKHATTRGDTQLSKGDCQVCMKADTKKDRQTERKIIVLASEQAGKEGSQQSTAAGIQIGSKKPGQEGKQASGQAGREECRRAKM